MKIIDLLNKIANEEEIPKKINFNGELYSYNDDLDYENQYGGFLMDSAVCICPEDLNTEVEIIEEPQEHKKPEKLKIRYKENDTLVNEKILQEDINDELANKINEILDYLEEIE